MEKSFKKDQNKFINHIERLGTNKEIREQLAKYEKLRAEHKIQYDKMLSYSILRNVIFIVSLFVFVMATQTIRTFFIATIVSTLLQFVVGEFIKKKKEIPKRKIIATIEKCKENAIYDYLERVSYKRDFSFRKKEPYLSVYPFHFLRFLSSSENEITVYLVEEKPLHKPAIPDGMNFKWYYLIEQDGEFMQMAVNEYGEIRNYIVYPVNKKTGRIEDENIQTVYLNEEDVH